MLQKIQLWSFYRLDKLIWDDRGSTFADGMSFIRNSFIYYKTSSEVIKSCQQYIKRRRIDGRVGEKEKTHA